LIVVSFVLQKALAFRGGTTLYKLPFTPAARYSDDVDLVQTRAEPAGPMVNAVRGIFAPWLGNQNGNRQMAV